MQTKEFIEKVEELGFIIRINYYVKDPSMRTERRMVIINKENGRLVASRWIDRVYEFDTNRTYFTTLPDETKKKLFNLLTEYSSTPIEERDKEKNEAEKEKKYYLKHKWMSFKRERYLKCIGGEYCLHDAEQPTKHKVQFTQIEIDKIKEKFDTDLSEFEMIEVKGEWVYEKCWRKNIFGCSRV